MKGLSLSFAKNMDSPFHWNYAGLLNYHSREKVNPGDADFNKKCILKREPTGIYTFRWQIRKKYCQAWLIKWALMPNIG